MEEYEFEAKVVDKLEKNGKKYVVLDKTHFYPDGKGGQLGDRGKIGSANVINVIEENGLVLHEVDQFPAEEILLCTIDKERRLDISREHTAQHILSGAIVKLFNIETVSFHMGEYYSTIDLESSNFTNEKLNEAENLANTIVLEDREVLKYTITKDKIKDLNLRKISDVEEPIRIVEVENFDVSMCGGTHVDKTGEIGIIKWLKYEKTKRELSRVYFASGLRALKAFQNENDIILNISNMLTTGEDELIVRVNKLVNENKELSNKIKALDEQLTDALIEKLMKEDAVVETLQNISRKSFERVSITLNNAQKKGILLLKQDDSYLVSLLSDIQFTEFLKTYNIQGVKFGIIKEEAKPNLVNAYKKEV